MLFLLTSLVFFFGIFTVSLLVELRRAVTKFSQSTMVILDHLLEHGKNDCNECKNLQPGMYN